MLLLEWCRYRIKRNAIRGQLLPLRRRYSEVERSDYESVRSSPHNSNDIVLLSFPIFVSELNQLEYDLAVLQTDFLRYAALELDVPTPRDADPEMWFSYPVAMSDAGRAKLRADIRKELKERFEVGQSRISFALAIIGSITGVTSLILTLSK